MTIELQATRWRLGEAALRWRTFGRETRGIAIIEFAMVLPILLAMCFGVLVLADAFAVKRKVAITTRTITDLTTQSATMTESMVTQLLNASASIVAPYDQSKLGLIVSEVDVVGSVGTIAWSRAYNATPLTKGTVMALPTAMVASGASVIVGQATYSYTPLTTVKFLGPIVLADKLYLNPRISQTITITP